MRNYLCLNVLILANLAVPTASHAQKQLAKSPKILSAKTVYFDNQTGAEAAGTAAVAQLKKWGRFQVVHDKQTASDSWAVINKAHFDLNTCLRESFILLKCFLRVLPGIELRAFQENVSKGRGPGKQASFD